MYGLKINSRNFTVYVIPHALRLRSLTKKIFEFYWSMESSTINKSYYIWFVFLTLGIRHQIEPKVILSLFCCLAFSTSVSTEVPH